MKKMRIAFACAAALMVICAGALVGCGQNAEDVIRSGVTKELDSLKNFDEAAISKIIEDAHLDSQFSQLGIDSMEFMRAYLDGFDYSIDSITINDKEAQVEVTLKGKSMSDFQEALGAAVEELSNDESVRGLSMSEIQKKMGEAVMDVLNNLQAKELGSVTLEYRLEGNTWAPSASSMGDVTELLLG